MKNLKRLVCMISPYNRGEKIFLSILTKIKEVKRVEPVAVFLSALKHVAPALKILPQIRAGRTIYITAALTFNSSLYYVMRWCLSKEGINVKIPLEQRMTTDLLDCLENSGNLIALKKTLNQSVIDSRVNAKAPYINNTQRTIKLNAINEKTL